MTLTSTDWGPVVNIYKEANTPTDWAPMTSAKYSIHKVTTTPNDQCLVVHKVTLTPTDQCPVVHTKVALGTAMAYNLAVSLD